MNIIQQNALPSSHSCFPILHAFELKTQVRFMSMILVVSLTNEESFRYSLRTLPVDWH
jgi:hypothetical protein